MSVVPLLVFLFILYALPVAIVGVPVAWWHRSPGWRWLDVAILFVPLFVWSGLSFVGGLPKSLSNAVVEPFLCGCVAWTPIVAKAITSRLGWKANAGYWIACFLSCLAAVGIYLAVPTLPE